jgi:hypothetical protein
MNAKAPVPRLRDQTPSWDQAAALARAWQLNQLSERLGKLALDDAAERPSRSRA